MLSRGLFTWVRIRIITRFIRLARRGVVPKSSGRNRPSICRRTKAPLRPHPLTQPEKRLQTTTHQRPSRARITSSMNMTHGASRRASVKTARAFFSLSPSHLFSMTLASTLRKVAPPSVATAFASIVLPVPARQNASQRYSYPPPAVVVAAAAVKESPTSRDGATNHETVPPSACRADRSARSKSETAVTRTFDATVLGALRSGSFSNT